MTSGWNESGKASVMVLTADLVVEPAAGTINHDGSADT
jgi:hypothetical protein